MRLKLTYILLSFIFLLSLYFTLGNSYKIHPNFSHQKQEDGIKKLTQIIKKTYPDIWTTEKGNDKNKIINIYNKFPQYINNEILQEAMKKDTYSLFETPSTENPLIYRLSVSSNEIKIVENTQALYYTHTPQAKFLDSLKSKSLDFKILTAVNFGLRGYLFNKYGEVEKEWGDYDTAYISTSYHERLKLIAWSVPGHKKIILIDARDLKIIKEFTGFSSEVVAFDSNHLYFFNRVNEKSNLYKIDLDTLNVGEPLLKEWDIQYPRGLIINEKENLLYISDTFNNRLLIVDLTSLQIKKEILNLFMPNGITLTQNNTLLIADEHNDTIRELNLTSFKEIYSFPSNYIRSPGDAIEIRKGNYKGCWLIADTDNNRILLVNPKTYQIYFEIKNLRSVMSIDIIYNDDLVELLI